MNHREHRGVSVGTVVMLSLTLAVVIGFALILPRLMGSANIHMEDRAMRSSTNLNDSLPELSLSEIPITNVTEVPAITETPAEPAAASTPEPSATELPTAEATPVVSGTVSLTFAGSVNMDDLIRKSGYYADSGKYDYTENLALIADALDSDHTLLTLETITDPSENVRQIPNAPDVVMDMLAAANVDMVALGYNRAFELGLQGVQATIAQARERGMQTLGLYDSQADAEALRLVEIDGVKVAFLHYTNSLTNTSKRKLNAADADSLLPTATVSTGADAIAADIRRAQESGAHIVIVSLNWSGSDSVSTTSTKMKNFMQALADAGADVIVGAGTKAVKEVSWIMGKRADGSTRQTLCAWSLGSLLNGERNNGNVTGMLLHLQMSYNGSSVSFERVTYTPTYIWRFKQDNYWRYRVVASDLPAPDGMDSSQAESAARAFENLKKTLGTSPVTLRTK